MTTNSSTALATVSSDDEGDDVIETEKDYSSIIPPMKDYLTKISLAVKTYEEDVDELKKIRDRVQMDTTNLTNLIAKIDAMILTISNHKAARQAVAKFATDCHIALDKAIATVHIK